MPNEFDYRPYSSISIVSLSICIPLIILSFIFCNRQPLKSRKWIPLYISINGAITFTLQIVKRLMNAYNVDTIEGEVFCYLQTFLQNPMELTVAFCFCLHLFRYFVILNINKHKETIQILEKNASGKQTKGVLLIFKKLTLGRGGVVFVTLMIAIVTIAWCVTCLIIIIVQETPFYCAGVQNNAKSIAFRVYIGLMAIFVIAVAIYDFVMNFKKYVKCQFKSLLFKNDPYLFRVEFVLVLLTLIYVGITEILKSFVLKDVTPAAILMDSFTKLFLLFDLALFTFAITCWRFLSEKCSKKEKEDLGATLISKIMSNEETKKMFKRYATSEWSIENVLLYEEIMEFKELKEPDLMKEKAMKIIASFLTPGSLLEVNITQQIVDVLKTDLEKGNLRQDMFDAALNCVIGNLSDTYTRFRTTKEYKLYMAKQELQTELMKSAKII